MKTVALLTGRGNNTLKDKNILDVLGKPVIYYPANASKKSNNINHWYCSSDDNKILDIAETIGYKRIVRPDELALPTSQHYDAIEHGLSIINQDDIKPDILVVILANNITIKSEWIDDCINLMKDDMSIDSVIPIYKDNDHHPFRAKSIDKNGMLQVFDDRVEQADVSTNRQDLPDCYYPAHNFWVLNVKNLKENKNNGQKPWGFMGTNILSYEIDKSIDIHEDIDLYIASQWIKEHYTD